MVVSLQHLVPPDAGEIPDSEQGTHISSTRMKCEHSFSALGGRQSPHLTDVEGHTYTTRTRGPLQTATGLYVLSLCMFDQSIGDSRSSAVSRGCSGRGRGRAKSGVQGRQVFYEY